MDRKEVLKSLKKIEATRRDILDLFSKNDIEANEALSLISGLLIQFYCGLVEGESREDFVRILLQCYDAHQLLHDDDEETVH